MYVPCFSQERFVVRGRILDAESAPVPYCSVSILESRDSTILGGAVSDTKGRYSLHFEQAGRYLHLAYESCYRTVEVPEAQTLPDVILRPASRHIDEVVVVARNTEYRAGRYEVNMLGNPIVRNRSVMQVLDLLPGLRVSENTLSIKGTPVSVVYIDDRLVTDLGELSALRAEDVKSVEVQNKTGAAYSATTSGGIVRIRLKKLATGSFYGNVSPSASVSRDDILRDSPCRSRPSADDWEYITTCRGSMGRTKRSTAPIPNFAIRDTRSTRRTGGGSPPGISAEL